MSKVRIVIYCLIALVVAGIGFGVANYQRFRDKPVALLSALPKNSDVSLDNIRHVATRDGVREWALNAKSAQYEQANNKTVFKEVFATFFLKDGNTVSLNGRDGALLTDTKDIEVWGDVKVVSGPYELNTNKLHYEHKTQVISTETPIEITGNGIEITGDSMIFNLQTEQVVVQGKVNALLEPHSERIPRGLQRG